MKQRARRLLKKNSNSLLPREVYVLSVVAFFVALGYGMIIPAIPLFAKTFQVNNAQIGAIISAFALARFEFANSHSFTVVPLGRAPPGTVTVTALVFAGFETVPELVFADAFQL